MKRLKRTRRGQAAGLVTILAVAALCLFASAGWSQIGPTSFRDDFSGATLDPAWTVRPGIGTFSLMPAPGSLLYGLTSNTSPDFDFNALWLSRPFSGTDWTLDTLVHYNMTAGLGRQLMFRVVLGDLSQRGINEVRLTRDRDDGGDDPRNKQIAQFIDGGFSGAPAG